VPNNRQVMERLLQAGVKLQQETRPETPSDLPWNGLTFVITGTLPSMSRREAESKVKALGGSAASSVTGKTDYLVAGESPGSKLNAATRLGTQVLDETAFLEMLGSAGVTLE
jgi:DNA ligase (NAD+)